MGAILIHVPNLDWVTDSGHRIDRMEISLMAMGLFPIADATEKAGIPVEIVNLHTSLTANAAFNVVEYVAQKKPEVIGFSVHWAKQIDSVLRFARFIHARLPQTKIILGGFTASYFAEQILRDHPSIFAVNRGDGEIPFREFAKVAVEGGTDFSAVPNILWRRDGKTVENTRTYTARTEDLETLDFARFDLLKDAQSYEPKYWTRRTFIGEQNAFLISTGRGCSFNCSFCGGAAAAQIVINNRKRYMFRSVDAVIKTMTAAVERGYTNMYFDYDPEPNGPYYHELFERVRKQGWKGLTCCFGAWKLPDDKFLDVMKDTFETGLLQISPETWSEEARLRNKDHRIHYTNVELERCISKIAQRGLFSQVYFGYVMPYDTREAIYRTLMYVDYLNDRWGHSCEARNLRFSTDPGSPAFQRPERYDITLFAPDLPRYLALMRESNRRGYLNNLQLFKVNSMSDQDNYLSSQMPPCFYHLQRVYPETTHLLTRNLGYQRVLDWLEKNILLPRWKGEIDTLMHTFVMEPVAFYHAIRDLAQGASVAGVIERLDMEHAKNVGPLPTTPEPSAPVPTDAPVGQT